MTRFAPIALVLCLASRAVAAGAPPDVAQLLAQVQERLAQLEARNAELERRLAATGPGTDALAARLAKLEQGTSRLDDAMASDRISQDEPEVATRLKAMESQVLDMQKQSKVIDSIDGFSAGASLTTVMQTANGVEGAGNLLNYRADVTLTTPTLHHGDIESRVFGHFRVGQGKGLSSHLTAFTGPNASSFQLGSVIEPASSALMLAEAWYQADIPLPFNGFKPHSRETLNVTFGKMDPFAFFAQNKVANDETRQFLASPFVHDALLDNPLAANVGADGYGFSPGLRVAYVDRRGKPDTEVWSLGVFGAGHSADMSAGFKSPFVIAQWEKGMRRDGLAGNYRFYAWSNGQAPTFASDRLARHRGMGVSIDQEVDDGITLFGRLGIAWGKDLPFDRGISLGAEINGGRWSRGADALGIGLAMQRVTGDFRASSATLDANGDGVPDYGFAATGWETTAELYYRYKVHQQFELSPDYQFIRRPAGNESARDVHVLGLRAQLWF